MKKHVFGAALALVAFGSTQAGAATPPGGAAKPDPCKLLTGAEVRAVFPDAKAAQLDSSKARHGVFTCVWNHAGGRFFAQQHTGELESFSVEGRGLIDGFLDPTNSAAEKAVRYESVKGVGDRALAIVERRDATKGILNDVAQIVVQRGDRQVILFSSQLPQRPRTDALRALESLGRAAAKRL